MTKLELSLLRVTLTTLELVVTPCTMSPGLRALAMLTVDVWLLGMVISVSVGSADEVEDVVLNERETELFNDGRGVAEDMEALDELALDRYDFDDDGPR